MLTFIRLIIGVLCGLCLYAEAYPLAMLTFAALAGATPRGIFGLYVVPCALGNLTTNDDNCGNKGGIAAAYWAKYSDIDWTAMAANVLNWNLATLTILDYIMVAAATFKKLEFDVKQSFYNFTFTEDTDVYTQVITAVFEGKSNAQTTVFRQALSCCNLVIHIFDLNGLERVVGVEWTGTAFTKQLKTVRIVRHLDASGQQGQARSRDEIDLGGESLRPPLYATVTQSGIPV